ASIHVAGILSAGSSRWAEFEPGRGVKFGVLQLTTAAGEAREFPLDLTSAIVGRGEGCTIRLEDPSLGRRHARLMFDSGRLMVEDLGSESGTYLDGRRLEPNRPALVERWAELRLGSV